MSLKYGAQRIQRRDDPRMRDFRSDRVGQFIHWGLYAIPAGRWKGRTYDFAAEFLPKSADIAPAEWERLVDEFAAPDFDATEWARMAKQLGARYLTITTKHHDGFCLWPSEHSDLTIAQTPFGRTGRDLLAELIDAYTNEGLSVHLYYSVLDWHHPDWRYRIETPEDEAAFARYLEFASAQLRELATRYPQVRGFWFDGTWDASVKDNGWWTLEVETMLKDLIPGALVNSRLRADDHGARHFDSNGSMMGDFESGFERRLPNPWDPVVIQRDWEACMTLTQGSWGRHVSTRVEATRKSPAEVTELIAHAVSRGGNILLNFGPDGRGSIVPEERALAESVGNWLANCGEAIYGCSFATGWNPPTWGHFTADNRTGTVYAIVTNPPVSGVAVVQVPEGTTLASITRVGSDAPIEAVEREQRQIALTVDRTTPMPEVFAITVVTAEGRPRTEVNPDVVT